MKSTLYQSGYVKYVYDADTSLFEEHWASGSLEVDIYKRETLKKRELLAEYKPRLILDNISESEFTIDPPLQEWTVETLKEVLIDIQLKRYAIVMPADIFTQVSVEQTVGDLSEVPFKLEYFGDIEKAIAWLNKD